MTRMLLIMLLALLAATGAAWARTWYIMPDGMGDAPTIKAGMDSAGAGDTVLVACGNYAEYEIVMKPGVALVSETGEPDCVTIHGLSQGRILLCVDIDSAASVVGITFQSGSATGHYVDGVGGAVKCRSSSLRFEKCVLLGNEGPYGGAMGLISSSPTLTEVDFIGNCSFVAGGLYCDSSSSPDMLECLFVGNCEGAMSCRNSSSPNLVGCMFTGYGSLGNTLECLFGSSPNLENCTFSDTDSRCPLYCAKGSAPVLTNCMFSGNTGIECGGLWVGSQASPVLTNCTFVGNDPGDGSGTIRCGSNGSLTLINCIIAYAVDGGAFACDAGECDPHLGCTDIYGNVGGDWEGCIVGQMGIDGNFSACPSFCDLEGGDYHLCSESPCLAGNHPYGEDCGLIGALAQGCACGPSRGEATTWGGIKATYR